MPTSQVLPKLPAADAVGGTSPGSTGSKSPRLDQGRAEAVQRLSCEADLLASRGRCAEALQLVEEAIRISEPQRSPELYLGHGQCLMRLGRHADALQSFQEALRLEPGMLFALRSRAAALFRLERWEDAIVCLREALRGQPGDVELQFELAQALTEQGVRIKTSAKGRDADAHRLFQEALQSSIAYAPAYFQLGVEHSEAGRSAEAKEMYTQAVQLQPSYVEAWNNLGVACRGLGEPDHAAEAYRMALKSNRNCKRTRENMAICLLEMGIRTLQQKEPKKAANLMKQALSYNSQNADVYFNLGVIYSEMDKVDKSRVNYELAVHFDPKHTNAQNNLGVIHRRQANLEAAIVCFERVLQLEPEMALTNKNLAAVYGAQGRMADAIRMTRTALDKNEEDAEAANNLALLYRDQGDVELCLKYLDICLRLEPESRHACSNRLMTINYPSEMTREDVFKEHRRWGEQIERAVPVEYTSWKATGNQSGPLRIGYISPDFYSHSVSFFIHAALRYHDPQYVHVTCYSDVLHEDAKTQLFRSFVPSWRCTHGVSDEEVAKMIHDDGIDILIELTGHTGNNRLAMLARKPAPVIATWIGYPHTTGMSRVDYRISDENADAPECPGLTSEKMVYLPECFLCYTPPDCAPPVPLKPAISAYGCPTFGCFNNLAKVSPLTVRLFCRVLREVPDSRLFLKSKALLCPEVQEKFRQAFVAHGIEASRVDLSGLQPHTGSHLQMYGLIDVALDTAPYAGTTTTCEALYMGVPVVTLRGPGIHAQNVGVSLLNAVQLGECIAHTEDEYAQRAAALARNVTRLSALRAGLRPRMLKSVLCDGPRHTARLERLYASLAAGAGSAGGYCESAAEVQ